MKFIEGTVILTNFREVAALDSAVVTAHKQEANIDPNTGQFIRVSPLLGKLAATRAVRYDTHDELMQAVHGFTAAARGEHPNVSNEEALELVERLEHIGETPMEVTITIDDIPEAAQALRQMTITHLELSTNSNTDAITVDEACALDYGETASRLLAFMTA